MNRSKSELNPAGGAGDPLDTFVDAIDDPAIDVGQEAEVCGGDFFVCVFFFVFRPPICLLTWSLLFKAIWHLSNKSVVLFLNLPIKLGDFFFSCRGPNTISLIWLRFFFFALLGR